MAGKFDDSIESLRKLVQQDPKNYRLYIELADCWVKKGDRDRAMEALAEFQKLGIRNMYVSEFMDKIRP